MDKTSGFLWDNLSEKTQDDSFIHLCGDIKKCMDFYIRIRNQRHQFMAMFGRGVCVHGRGWYEAQLVGNLIDSNVTIFFGRVFEWVSSPSKDIREVIKVQKEPSKNDFDRRTKEIIQSLNIQVK